VAVDRLCRCAGAAVEEGEGHVGILLSGLEHRDGVLVARGEDQVVAQVAVGDDVVVVGGLVDHVGVVGLPAPLLGGVHHGVVAAHAPPAVGDAGVGDHGDLIGLAAVAAGGVLAAALGSVVRAGLGSVIAAAGSVVLCASAGR